MLLVVDVCCGDVGFYDSLHDHEIKLLSWVSNSLTLSLIIVSLVEKFETILFFTLRQRIEKSLMLCKSNIHVKCSLHSYIHMHMWINLMPHLTTKNDITCLR